MTHQDRRPFRRAQVTPAALIAALPVVLGAAVFVHGPAARPVPVTESATMWLASARGALVRANGLVSRPAEQIIDTVPYAPAAHGVHLSAEVPGAVFATTAGQVSRVDVRAGRAERVAGDPVIAAGPDVYQVGADTVTRLDPATLRPTGSWTLGRTVAVAAGPDAAYVATSAGLSRVDATGVSPVADEHAGGPVLMDGVADGVAVYHPERGGITVVRGRSAATAGTLTPGPATTFAAAPDGRAFAVVAGREVRVWAAGRPWSAPLAFTPGTGALADGRLYLADPAAGRVHVLGLSAGLPEQDVLDFHAPGRMELDVHRRDGFLWLDDVRGPEAYVIREGHARQIVKYVTPSAPPTSRSAAATTAPPPTTTPPTKPPRSPDPPRPSRSRHDPKPSASTHPSRRPATPSRPSTSPATHPSTQTPDPRAKCGGHDASITVDDADRTGPDPRVTVRVCVKAGGDQYWIVTRSEGKWYAKRPVSGAVGRQSYVVHLLHGSGTPGQHRQFSVVAARSPEARQALAANRDADIQNADYPRDELPSGVDKISAPCESTS
ncbi:Polycystic kidney disease protein 1-like 3 [Actinoplanes sp. SE50]|uniref:hypothetical protein n=1 Tax=unclassified Actinoplanes TaxID=2626549 RepID=UPI00023EC427|nr:MULTISPECIES: hypothetical protein [unclassified Actinoplanes]AEV83583.1 Polycystic kidney disease protein 1-like 3 [Actinoplanes sp. SE50/110]ATO82273.1 Polycystic kidney disease protein 1-like 3 [Actinoplanes sp. SE50]SLL99680.1 polycystic kidney disease 1-like 3 [Actinoplanes sp. SE50/110]